MLIHEAPLDNVKVSVWCVMSATRITGPIILGQQKLTLIGTCSPTPFLINYMIMKESRPSFKQTVPQLTPPQTTLYIINITISKELQPPCLPDLNSCNFYLWGMLKHKVHSNNLCTESDLTKKNHSGRGFLISPAQLQCAMNNLSVMSDLCLWAEGAPSLNMMNKNSLPVTQWIKTFHHCPQLSFFKCE